MCSLSTRIWRSFRGTVRYSRHYSCRIKANHLLGSELCYLCALMLHFENNLPVSGGCVHVIWTVILSRAGLARGRGVKPNRNVCNRFAKIGFSLVLGGGSRLFHAKALSPRTYVCPAVYFTLKNALRGRIGCFYFFNVFYFSRCGITKQLVFNKRKITISFAPPLLLRIFKYPGIVWTANDVCNFPFRLKTFLKTFMSFTINQKYFYVNA